MYGNGRKKGTEISLVSMGNASRLGEVFNTAFTQHTSRGDNDYHQIGRAHV